MNVTNIIYLSLIIISFFFSLGAGRFVKTLRLFPILLGASLVTEGLVYFMYYHPILKPYYFSVYHVYIPIEYTLLTYYFSQQLSIRRTKAVLLYSIPCFLGASIILSWSIGLFNFPGYNLNLAGILIMIWSIIALFNIQPRADVTLFTMPLFWISVGVLVNYAGGAFFNSLYQHLLDSDLELSKSLNHLVNKGLNYVLYLCFITAFICSRRMKESM